MSAHDHRLFRHLAKPARPVSRSAAPGLGGWIGCVAIACVPLLAALAWACLR